MLNYACGSALDIIEAQSLQYFPEASETDVVHGARVQQMAAQLAQLGKIDRRCLLLCKNEISLTAAVSLIYRSERHTSYNKGKPSHLW